MKVLIAEDDPASRLMLESRLTKSQISNYGPYAGAGCFDTSVSAEAIQTTIRQVLACKIPSSGVTMTQRRDFDSAAAAWDEEPRRVKLACEIVAAICKNLPLSAEWDALDFGCGTGLVTLPLSQHIGNIVGLDSSLGMLECLRKKIQAFGCINVQTTRCDLEKGELPDGKFHLITSSMTLHHIPEIVPVLQSLRGLLNPYGWIALADLETEDGSFHDDLTGVFHNGFSAEEFSDMLEQVGFTSISVHTITTIVKGYKSFPVLLATAQTS